MIRLMMNCSDTTQCFRPDSIPSDRRTLYFTGQRSSRAGFEQGGLSGRIIDVNCRVGAANLDAMVGSSATGTQLAIETSSGKDIPSITVNPIHPNRNLS